MTSEFSQFPHYPSSLTYKCFPVRSIRKCNQDEGGAWVVELKAEKKRQLEALTKRKKYREKQFNAHRDVTKFTCSYLMKQFCVDEPSDLCCVNISGKDLHTEKSEDFSAFKNIVNVDASDNQLSLETFRSFPKLEELQLQVNSISCIHTTHNDFPLLCSLNLSYNAVNGKSLLNLGKLRNLQKLHLQGCELSQLPPELARGYQISENDTDEKKEKCENKTRFPKLTHLNLSENRLTDITTFASVAGLQKLESLDLSHNKITGVPHLRLMVTHRHFSLSTCHAESVPRIDHVLSAASKKSSLSPKTSLPDKLTKAAPLKFGTARKKKKTKIVSELDQFNDHPMSVSDQLSTSDPVTPSLVSSPDHVSLSDPVPSEPASSDPVSPSDHVSTSDNVLTSDPIDDKINVSLEDDISQAIDDVLLLDDNEDETDELLNMNFGNEFNFSLTGDITADNLFNPMDEENLNLTVEDLINDEIMRPFPCLETLDLSCNQIADEESLLPLASWPCLQVLKVWGNPLMTSFKGTPPVLAHHLQKMCGITIHRKAPKIDETRQPIAPSIAKTAKSYRVKTDLPPIKRNNLLMIEAAITDAIESKKLSEGKLARNDSKDELNEGDVKASSDIEKENGGNENIFITQVDEVEQEKEKVETPTKMREKPNKIERKYQGYELLLKDDDSVDATDGDVPLPSTLQGSVLALKHMLDHPLVFKDGSYNENRRKHHQRTKKARKTKSAPPKQHVDGVTNALENIRIQQTSYQDNLGDVIERYDIDPETRRRFPEVKNMMKRVQHKYDEVRFQSLRPVSASQDQQGGLDTRTDRPTQELILSRMKHRKIGDMYPSSNGGSPRTKFRGTTPVIRK